MRCELAAYPDEKYAGTFIDNLISGGDLIYLAAAEPVASGALGPKHCNELSNSCWIAHYKRSSFPLGAGPTERARRIFCENDVVNHLATSMNFRRAV
jgi:hypothetical protein